MNGSHISMGTGAGLNLLFRLDVGSHQLYGPVIYLRLHRVIRLFVYS